LESLIYNKMCWL